MEKIWILERNALIVYYQQINSRRLQNREEIGKLRGKIAAFKQLYQELLSGSSFRIDVDESSVVTEIRGKIGALEEECARFERVLEGNNPVDAKVIQCLAKDSYSVILALSNQELSLSTLARYVKACCIVDEDKTETIRYLESCFDDDKYGKRARIVAAFAEYYYGEQKRAEKEQKLRTVGEGNTANESRNSVKSQIAELRKEYQKEEQRILEVERYAREEVVAFLHHTKNLLAEIEKKKTDLQELEENAISSLNRAEDNKKRSRHMAGGRRLTFVLCSLLCIVPFLFGFGSPSLWFMYVCKPKGIISYFPAPFMSDMYITEDYDAPYVIAWGPRKSFYIKGSGMSSKKWIMPFSEIDYQSVSGNQDEEIFIAGNSKSVAITECDQVKTITIPEGTENVSLRGCKSVQKLILPGSVEQIRIEGCPRFETIEFSDGKEGTKLKEIYISGSTSLTRLDVPKGVEKVEINNCLFLSEVDTGDATDVYIASCENLRYVTLGSSIDMLSIDSGFDSYDSVINECIQEARGQAQIQACEKLASVSSDTLKLVMFGYETVCTLPETVKYVTMDMRVGAQPDFEKLPYIDYLEITGYDNASELETVEIPVNAKHISTYYFRYAERLIFSGDVKEIEIHGFGDNHPLKEIVIPDTVESIATYETINLESVVAPDGFDWNNVRADITYKQE